mmetsp:Transcript_67216/g.112565  ORF Transcript_67216/g.112565 Transcript_67216/m.112565 type:complete len:163 (+) Transcript_67216:599-1087(+)
MCSARGHSHDDIRYGLQEIPHFGVLVLGPQGVGTLCVSYGPSIRMHCCVQNSCVVGALRPSLRGSLGLCPWQRITVLQVQYILTLKTQSDNKTLMSAVYILLQGMDLHAEFMNQQLNEKQTHKQPIAMLSMISHCNQHLHSITCNLQHTHCKQQHGSQERKR